MSNKPKVLSLFSGVGGFDLGLERAGMETVFQCEWDKHATQVLERHWPDVPRWGDITTLTGEHILRHAPVVDVVAWGSPCQDLSVAGKRAGLGGERSGMFYEGIRIINELRRLTNGRYPRISIWENVPGALSSNRGSDFGRVLHEMDEAGAHFSEWRILDAQYFGVPQRRRRVFVVSVFDSATAERCPEPLLSVSEGLRRDSAQSKSTKEAIANTSAGSVAEHGGNPILIDRAAFNQGENAKFDPVISEDPVVPSLVARGPHAVATFVKSKRAQNSHDNETWVEGQIAPTLNPFDSLGTRTTSLVAFDTQFGSNAQVYEDMAPPIKSSQQAPSIAYSIREDRKANTFSATQLDRVNALSALTPSTQSHHAQTFIAEANVAVRRLTPMECERLMGWPDDWTVGQTDTQRYRQCGNGVASPVAQWIGDRIMEVLCGPR